MNPVHSPLNYIETIKGTAADFDGQVAYNCTILKARVKRGPGKGRVFVKRIGYYDLECFELKGEHKFTDLYGDNGVLVKAPEKTLTDDEFVEFLKGDALNVKLIAYDKEGNEIDLDNFDPLSLLPRADPKLVDRFIKANDDV